ncbi:MAG: Maf family protein [Candidatus Babeliales bacterium]
MTIPILIASSSRMRHTLLEEMQLPFIVINQTADESIVPNMHTVEEAVRIVAERKMDAVQIPALYTHHVAYVITADTLGTDAHGNLYGKPSSHEQAKQFLRALRGTNRMATALCVEKRMRAESQGWHVEERITQIVATSYVFDMSDAWIERYLKAVPEAMHASGALTIEGYGAQFIKSITGSYTAVLGLPAYELRLALTTVGYF